MAGELYSVRYFAERCARYHFRGESDNNLTSASDHPVTPNQYEKALLRKQGW